MDAGPLDLPLDVTPNSTISTTQFQSEVINTLIHAILIGLMVANINSIVSKLVHLTHNKDFRYSSFLRVFIFHHSDDPVALLSWLRRAYSSRRNLSRSKYKICKNRFIAPLGARMIIFIATIVSIAITIPSEKRLTGCDDGDVFPDLQRQLFQGPPSFPGRAAPVCSELPMKSRRGSVRTRASFCSVPVYPETRNVDRSAIVVDYNNDTAVIYTGVLSQNPSAGSDKFVLQASEAYVEWVDKENRNSRSLFPTHQKDQHIAIVMDAIQSIIPNCERTGAEEEENGLTFVPVGCSFDAVNVSRTADAYLKKSLRWKRRKQTMERRLVNGEFSSVRYCPIDISVTRPIVNMVPLVLMLVLLFTINLAVGITTSERGEVLQQTFGLVKEVLGHDCMSSAIEKSSDISGAPVAKWKKWVCSGGVAFHEGVLKGEGCDEVDEFPKDAVVSRCRYADGSGRRMVNVPQGDDKFV